MPRENDYLQFTPAEKSITDAKPVPIRFLQTH